MNEEVEVDAPSVEAWRHRVREKCVDHRKNVVIPKKSVVNILGVCPPLPVKEHQRTLSEDEEDGVNKLEHLGNNEQPHPVAGVATCERAQLAVRICKG